jgi:uncharacterized RDD family membrane protein YckC
MWPVDCAGYGRSPGRALIDAYVRACALGAQRHALRAWLNEDRNVTGENPYATPTAAVIDKEEEVGELAGRGQRLAAAIVDGIIGMALASPMMVLLGTFDYLKAGQPLPVWLTIVSTGLGFVLFALVNGYFLKTNGQTIGKKMIGIKIVDMRDELLSLGRVLGLRYLPITLVTAVPILGQILPLIDVLFIFRKDRRCLHDLIAGTRVVRAR